MTTEPQNELSSLLAPELLSLSACGHSWGLTPVFAPLWRADGSLYALELLSQLHDPVSGDKLPPDTFFSQAAPREQMRALRWQMTLLTGLQPLCRQCDIPISININRTLAMGLLTASDLPGMVREMAPYIRLEISEHFLSPPLPPGKDVLLEALQSLAPLWLDDYGAGTTSLPWLMSGTFEQVKIDRHLFDYLFRHAGGRDYLKALGKLARVKGTGLVAEGVEDETLLAFARKSQVQACQGWRWPHLTLDELATLPASLPEAMKRQVKCAEPPACVTPDLSGENAFADLLSYQTHRDLVHRCATWKI